MMLRWKWYLSSLGRGEAVRGDAHSMTSHRGRCYYRLEDDYGGDVPRCTFSFLVPVSKGLRIYSIGYDCQ